MATPGSPSTSYVCDTLPAPRLATSNMNAVAHDDEPQSMLMDFDTTAMHDESDDNHKHVPSTQPPARKLCVRHQRMADEGTNLKLQQSLDALPVEEREFVNAIWANFSSSSHPRRAIILQGLLTMCCFSQLSLITEQLAHLIRIDPFRVFPREVSLKVLRYLDATSLCRAAQVTQLWRSLADDDVLWRGICEQHIGQKCHKCGWGLPLLEKKRTYCVNSVSPCPSPNGPSVKRSLDETDDLEQPQAKRLRYSPLTHVAPDINESHSLLPPNSQQTVRLPSTTRPWKDVYSERMTVERNWRRGRCTMRTIKGHTDGVMCMQYSETLAHPQFPVLITGSYDRTARVWNLETGAELLCLRGHSRAVRALQFDEVKLITGSMDTTLKVWDWRRGKCIRTLTGHSEGVVCLNFDSNVLASGSVDSTIKVWNLRTGAAFTLRGHSDWVNSVQLWDSNPSQNLASPPAALDTEGSCSAPQIDPGKMLFSASDDGSIKLWDLTLRSCVRQFLGHVGQVQSMKLLVVNECDEDENESASTKLSEHPSSPSSETSTTVSTSLVEDKAPSPRPLTTPTRRLPVLISGSLDNTIKIWDIDTGKTLQTFFGHIEGVWGVASDKMRLVSGSHDRTIKVWSREEDKCTATLVGHRAAISCVALGEDKIISGSDDNDIIVWSFSGEQ